MEKSSRVWDDLSVEAQLATFKAEGGMSAVHAMLHVDPCDDLFEGQFQRIYTALTRLQTEFSDIPMQFCRIFVSDSTNQEPVFQNYSFNVPVSFIQQPPLDGSKVAVWAYFFHTSETRYKHIWEMGLTSSGTSSDSYSQTSRLLEDYEQRLSQCEATIASNCVRTWFFVRDVDTNYKGLVDARRENFIKENLTSDTHYIASTGIGGLPADTSALVQLDTYTVLGLTPHQQRYLYAKTHLNSTYEYGVTFERGTAVDYDDYTEIFISGTASIDNKGEVLHLGNIVLQTERMLENVSELLKEGGAGMDDVMQCIVYLRDVADYRTVSNIFHTRFPHLPLVITNAPVCRPAWLIEMECIAIKEK